MPFIHVRLFKGRTTEQKRAFVEAVTKDASPNVLTRVLSDALGTFRRSPRSAR